MEDESHNELRRDNVINIKGISTLRKQNNKGENQFESLPAIF